MKRHFALFYWPGPNRVSGQPVADQPLEEHLNYMQALNSDGIVKLGGPFEDGSGGLRIVEAEHIDDVYELVDWDPAVRSGILAVDVVGWDRFV